MIATLQTTTDKAPTSMKRSHSEHRAPAFISNYMCKDFLMHKQPHCSILIQEDSVFSKKHQMSQNPSANGLQAIQMWLILEVRVGSALVAMGS